ncbi:MAG: hypothetical protein VKQ33_02595 [Candidatus Sericytochromatia bacterium]|nr:hypothetical protein [Candidatus Sericytochromatia bacterium]
MNAPDRHPDVPPARKPYEKPRLESHRVFEVSLSCIKIPGSPACAFNVARTRS